MNHLSTKLSRHASLAIFQPQDRSILYLLIYSICVFGPKKGRANATVDNSKDTTDGLNWS